MSAQESALAKDAPDDAFRATFAARVSSHGLKLSATEAESVFKLASWLNDGVAGLGDALPGTVLAADHGLLDLSFFEQGLRLRDGPLTSVALVRAHLHRIEARDGAYRSFYVVSAERA